MYVGAFLRQPVPEGPDQSGGGSSREQPTAAEPATEQASRAGTPGGGGDRAGSLGGVRRACRQGLDALSSLQSAGAESK